MWGVFLNLFRYLWGLCSPSSLEMERNEPTRSDLNFGASSSSTSLPVGDYEGGTKKTEENDYEVFLSFRGKDTRNGFTTHLYKSLNDAGIHVFRDDNELRVGEEIGPELIRSITQSKISIPIISEDYASSKWCLRELALMLNCRRNKGQMVLPIFYKVEPRQVEHITGRFGDAIKIHKKNLEEKIVKEWEEALKEVSSLKGLESEKIANGDEATLVETVFKIVVRELKRLFLLDLPEHLVGIDDQLRRITGTIDAKFNDTRIIGIYGMGGVGKTTLAMALYNELSSHYEYRSFVLNIRETSKGKGIEHVQEKLFCDITKKSWDAYDVNEGICILKSRLTSKKVLILLDDVDDNTHLKALIGDKSWFKSESVVIITTRNKSILDKASADCKHLLEGLPLDPSLILFSRHAFRKDSPPSDYDKISHALVSTTKGLPLAIVVIASLLSDKGMEKWKNILKELEELPAKEVRDSLMISYEALSPREKHIFLDIACFFIGESQQNPTYFWDACGFSLSSGIEELSHRSLINIDKDGTFVMHDLLRDLGREIVRQEGLTAPQNRSRLWSEEAKWVLDSNIGTSKIEALAPGLYDGGGSYTAETFKELTNLRFLKLNNVNLTGDFQNLLPQLRWLVWSPLHMDFELTNLHLKKLVVLGLSSKEISDDWGGFGPLKMATKLKVLNLEDCSMRTTLDLSAFKSLEILKLERCYNLEEIHPSIEDVKTLVSLNVNYCRKMKELPLGVGRMEKLRELLMDSTNIREIPISEGCLTELETLNASRCRLLTRLPKSLESLVSLTQLNLSRTGIEELPESIGSLKKLETLDASYCVSLAHIPNSIGNLISLFHLDLTECHKLTQLPNSIGFLLSLPRLLLSGCHLLRKIPNSIGKLTSLTELSLRSTAIEELPESIGFLKELKILDASYCASLARIPNSIGNLTYLSRLDLKECHKLAQLPDSIGSLVSLSQLLLSGCHLLRQIPNSIEKLTSLTELHLKSTTIEELPEFIGSLKELKTLDVSYCASLAYIPNSIGNSTSLSRLDLTECHKLAQLPDSIGSLMSLSQLLLSGCHSLRQIPDSILKLPVLTEMDHRLVITLPVTYNNQSHGQSHGQSSCSSNDLPKNVVMTLSQGSLVKSMDFHPVQQILLLVGTNIGDVMVWDVGSRARIALRNFKVWNLGKYSVMLQASLASDYTASVNRVMWSPKGTLFGVAYSKHMVHIYSYHGGDDICNHLEIKAHVGSVNDLAFSYPNKLCVVTCGEDRLIKVWDAATGATQHCFKGHEASVYSICLNHKKDIEFIFSTAMDFKIKVWLYDNIGSRVECDVPGHSSTMMAYSADGTRLFPCGTNKEGESYLVEWNESEGGYKRIYHGLGERSGGVVQFDTTQNRFLAAGDEFMVKFWDMDNNNMLASTDADGGLPASPCIRSNKEGVLLAVSTSDNSVKILANADGIRLLRTVENLSYDPSRVTPILSVNGVVLCDSFYPR